MEDIKLGDTFVDDEGEPRRVTEITEDGKIHTADGTERTYDQDVEHFGGINSPRAQLARGGKFIPPISAEAKAAIGGTDLEYRGHDEYGINHLHDPQTGTTLAVFDRDLDNAKVKERLAAKRAEFGIKPDEEAKAEEPAKAEAPKLDADGGHKELYSITKNAGYSIPTRDIFPNEEGISKKEISEAAMSRFPKSRGSFAAEEAKPETVELKSLQGIQKTVDADAVYANLNKIKRGDLSTDLVDPEGENGALVLRYKGKNYIVDGNHRLAALKLAGADKARVELVDLDSKTELPNLDTLVKKLNKRDWWHVPPAEGEGAYAKRGKFMASSYKNAEFYGRPLDEPQKVNIKNPLVGTEEEIGKELGIEPQTKDMTREEMAQHDSKWAKAAKKLGYDAIVTVAEKQWEKFKESGRQPTDMEVNDLTHLE